MKQTDNAAAVSALEGVSQHVEGMVDELEELNRSAKFLLLSDPQVQQELGISRTQSKQLQSAIDEVEAAHREFGEKLAELDGASVDAMEKQIAELVVTVAGQLSAGQLKLLEEIAKHR